MSLIIDLKVVPGAKHGKVILDKADRLVFYIKSIAQDNKANEELIKTLALKLNIPKSHVEIISGHKARYKRILLDEKGLTLDIVLSRLNIEKQEINLKIW